MNFDDAISHNLSSQYPYLVIYIQTNFLGVFNASAVHVQIATLCKCLADETKKSKAKSYRLSDSLSFWPVFVETRPLNRNLSPLQLIFASLIYLSNIASGQHEECVCAITNWSVLLDSINISIFSWKNCTSDSLILTISLNLKKTATPEGKRRLF